MIDKPLEDYTVRELIQLLKDTDCSMMFRAILDINNNPLFAIIIVEGEETKEILDAIEEVGGKWNYGEVKEEYSN